MKEARAYNQSIYFMVSMPYLLLGTFGAVFYWKNKMAHRAKETLPFAGENPPVDI